MNSLILKPILWIIQFLFKKAPTDPPSVFVTRNGAPAENVELIDKLGKPYAVPKYNAVALLPAHLVGTLIIVRALVTGRELARFTLVHGVNEVVVS